MRRNILSRLTAAAADVKPRRRREKVAVIMGATGTGKTKLSLDIATRYPAEIINSDKIQVYRGLDITTNKIPPSQRRSVPHHLLGSVDPASGQLSPSAFRHVAGEAVESISRRGRLPVIAGGSNSFVRALLTTDPNAGRLRYRCLFVWVHVEEGVLMEYLDRRVEEMVGSGMVEELEDYFRTDPAELEKHVGLGKAIGVSEFRAYFGKKECLSGVVEAVKRNTRRLAEEQVRKIRQLEEVDGWALRRVDATAAVRARLGIGEEDEESAAWERDVAARAFEALEDFLKDGDEEEDWDRLNILPP